MSDAPKSEPKIEVYSLTLGRGVRSIACQGEGAEAINRFIVAKPRAQRAIAFQSCRMRGDIEIADRKVNEIPIAVYVDEWSPDHPPWPDELWKIGGLAWQFNRLSLAVPSVAFQPLWDVADAPESEQFDVRISSQVHPDGIFVYAISFEGVRAPTHPVVSEVKKLGQTLGRVVPVLGWFFAVAIVMGSLIQWLLR